MIANDVGGAIYTKSLPDVLASRKYLAAPEPQVVGKGLAGGVRYDQEGGFFVVKCLKILAMN